MDPATSNFAWGFDVPIPTLPEFVARVVPALTCRLPVEDRDPTDAGPETLRLPAVAGPAIPKFPAFMLAAEKFPETLASPTTSRVVVGSALLMPMLPSFMTN